VALLVQYACMRGIFNLIYSCFFSSLNNLPTYSRTLYLASSHRSGTRTRRSLQRSGRSCQSELWNLMFAGITGKETPLSLDLLLLPPRLQGAVWKYGAVDPILLPEL